ncbi:MAG: GAF domain-containing sensor histidine kinase, partial [Ignavibacteriaceae bacterium]|nr:GAF domain-containing sensor histidine kinase [Ignavibacteriaceae bacterium]
MEKIVEKILELSKFSDSKFPINNFLEELLFKILDALHAEFCTVALLDKTDDQLYYHIGCWQHAKLTKTFFDDFARIKKGTGAVGICAEQRIVQGFENQDILLNVKKDYEEKFNIRATAVLTAPMLSRGELIGVIEVLNKSGENMFSEDDKNVLKIFSNYAAITVDNARLFDDYLAKDRISYLGQSIMKSAHGLKNILNNMDGGVFIAEKGASLKDFKEVEKGWDIIKRNSNRLREMVLDILLFSRPKKPEYKLSNINQICDDIEELLAPNAKELNVEIKNFLDRSIKDFCFDPKGIHRCLLNLISNAVYACSQKGGGRVNVTTILREKTFLEIKVSDNGIGISKDSLPHIFDVFYTTKGSGGTGLGLAVTKKIIDEHNGTIKVSSTVNIGTKFIITLPNYK